jgi:hypothetical protein
MTSEDDTLPWFTEQIHGGMPKPSPDGFLPPARLRRRPDGNAQASPDPGLARRPSAPAALLAHPPALEAQRLARADSTPRVQDHRRIRASRPRGHLLMSVRAMSGIGLFRVASPQDPHPP